MTEYKEGDRVLVDAVDGSTGFVEVEITALEYNYFNDLRYRAGKRIIHPSEIRGHSFDTAILEAETISANPDSDEPDHVNHPEHYTSDPSGIECIEITRHRNFAIGSAIKYLWRAGRKGEEGKTSIDKQVEDLNKSIWYIKDEINRLKNF